MEYKFNNVVEMNCCSQHIHARLLTNSNEAAAAAVQQVLMQAGRAVKCRRYDAREVGILTWRCFNLAQTT